MTKEVEIIDPCVSDEWVSFINTHPDAGVFHHPSWLRMLRDVYGYRMFAVCTKNGNKITAGIPFADVRSSILGKRWVSLPFSDHCQPLLPAADPECTKALMAFLKGKQGVETPKIEVRWNLGHSENLFYEEAFVTHLLDLEKDPTVVRSKFHKQSLLRSLVKAEKEGVVVHEGTTREDLLKFYNLQVMTRKRLGVPAQPRYFFEGVWKYIIEPGLGYILIAYKDGQAIGGGVYFKFGKTVYYKYGASDFEYRQYRPSHACMWEAIRRSCVGGYQVFDFGRSDKNNEGLRRFKKEWGSREMPLGYSTIANAQPKAGSSRFSDFVGVVIRNSPDFVCKLSGELLYKHFA